MISKTLHGKVFQINVKRETSGERGLPKFPTQRAMVTKTGLDGDFDRWRHEEAHDDVAMAILVMPLETIEELSREGWRIKPGDIGENITTEGFAYSSFAPGNRYQMGNVVIRITKPCDPCSNLYALPNIGKDKDIVKGLYNRRGWYASVEREGWVTKGDSITEVTN